MIIDAIRNIIKGQRLSESEMETVMTEVMDGKATASQVGALVTALRMRTETMDEITGATKALQSRIQRFQISEPILNFGRDEINVEGETLLHTSENGKGKTRIFNVSTATIFVVAGAGVKVVRHGHRAGSMHFGACDVLEHLGIRTDLSGSDVEQCIREIGVGFYFIPLFQGPMQYVARLREEMGIRTIFNLIGLLMNPMGASTHVLGVYRPELTDAMAYALKRLGAESAFVIHGAETFDEISICGPTRLTRLIDGKVTTQMVEPEDFGYQRTNLEAIKGGDAATNAGIIRDILSGTQGARRDIVELNAAAAFVASGKDNSISDGISRAREVIDSGKAMDKLNALVSFSGRCAPFIRKQL